MESLAIKSSASLENAPSVFKKIRKIRKMDYDKIQKKFDKLNGAKQKVEFYVDANQNHNKFGITDEEGTPLWWGDFENTPSSQAQAELEAAKKAVWLARKIRKEIGKKSINLYLKVDAQWLEWANKYDGSKLGGQAAQLAILAMACKVDLFVIHVPSSRNLADEFTRKPGGKGWEENDLKSLSYLGPTAKYFAKKKAIKKAGGQEKYDLIIFEQGKKEVTKDVDINFIKKLKKEFVSRMVEFKNLAKYSPRFKEKYVIQEFVKNKLKEEELLTLEKLFGFLRGENKTFGTFEIQNFYTKGQSRNTEVIFKPKDKGLEIRSLIINTDTLTISKTPNI